MHKNLKRFTLAYSSLLFRLEVLNQLGYCVKKYAALDLVFNNVPLSSLDAEL